MVCASSVRAATKHGLRSVCLTSQQLFSFIQLPTFISIAASRFAARETAILYARQSFQHQNGGSRYHDQLFSRLRVNKVHFETLHRRIALFLPADTFTGYEERSARAQLLLLPRDVRFSHRLCASVTASISISTAFDSIASPSSLASALTCLGRL